MKRVKGFGGRRRRLLKAAKVADTKAGSHAYRDRRVKKRQFRQLWQVRINAALRPLGMSYSQFMGGLKKHGIGLDRKVLSQIAAQYPKVLEQLVAVVKK